MSAVVRRTRVQSRAARVEIMRLRLQGKTLEQTGEIVGMTIEGVRQHELAWLAERAPSTEVTEERRQMALARLDARRAALTIDDSADPDDPADLLRLRLMVEAAHVKLDEREARLLGLDLQPAASLNVTVVTAESIAALLGYDEQQGVIEGTATEVTDGQ